MRQENYFQIDAALNAGPLSWDHTSTFLAFTDDSFKPVVLDVSSNTIANVIGKKIF